MGNTVMATDRSNGLPDDPANPEEDWSAWSRAAVALMQERNKGYVRNYGLDGRPYYWSFDDALLVFTSDKGEIVVAFCVLGSVSETEGTFQWAWANPAIPSQALDGIESIRAFGRRHGLERLTKPEWRGNYSDGLEMAAVGARILNADGVWIEPTGDATLFFALSDFRTRVRPCG